MSNDTDAAYRAWLDHVLLVRSPETVVPRPISKLRDLHPLPDSLDPYCTYPWSVEEYVRDPSSGISSASVEAHLERQAAYLEQRREKKELEEQKRLRRLAPGWAQGDRSILQPVRLEPSPADSATEAPEVRSPSLWVTPGPSGDESAASRTPDDRTPREDAPRRGAAEAAAADALAGDFDDTHL